MLRPGVGGMPLRAKLTGRVSGWNYLSESNRNHDGNSNVIMIAIAIVLVIVIVSRRPLKPSAC